jgi:hypothetical protein
MKDRCREIEEQVARLEAEIEGYTQESGAFQKRRGERAAGQV